MTFDPNLDPSQEFGGATGGVLVSPLGTDWPETAVAIPDDVDGAWLPLGLATDAGPRFTYGRTVKKTMSWQQFFATREDITELPTKVDIDFQQWNNDTISLGLGGPSFSDDGAGGVLITPPDPTFKDERQLIIYAQDGERLVAQCWRRVLNTKELAFAYSRIDPSVLPLGFDLLGPPAGETDAYFWRVFDPDGAIVADGS